MTNLSKQLKEVMADTYIKYSGCLIERVGGKFLVHEDLFDTLELAKKEIDQSFVNFSLIIKRSQNVSPNPTTDPPDSPAA